MAGVPWPSEPNSLHDGPSESTLARFGILHEQVPGRNLPAQVDLLGEPHPFRHHEAVGQHDKGGMAAPALPVAAHIVS